MTVCLTCKRRNECDHKWKDDEFMVGCTGYIESRTNFDRITESPEKLAKFLGTWFALPCDLCEHFRDYKCTAKISDRRCYDAEAFEKWLNEESKE